MTVKNPKNKGNGFERRVAKLFSEWTGVKFMRTPSSGAIHNFNDKRVVSDIVPPLSIGKFPFSIECKNVNCSWEFSNLLEDTSQTIKDHWKQCEDDANREGLVPLLVFTKNYRPVLAVMPYRAWDCSPSVIQSIPHLVLNNIWAQSLVMFKLDKFMEVLKVEELIENDLFKYYSKGSDTSSEPHK